MLAVAFWSDPYHPVAGEDDEVLALLDWYTGCRRADGVVSRAKVDPVVLRPWIGRICLYHREPDGRFRVRLRGERVGSGEHSNDGALYIDDNRPPDYRDCQLRDFRTAIARAEPSLHRVSIRAGDDTVSYRRVLIPVALTPGAADMLLLFNPDAQPGGRPEFVRVFDRARWLAIGVVPPESA